MGEREEGEERVKDEEATNVLLLSDLVLDMRLSRVRV
jgi:hypothetical protein